MKKIAACLAGLLATAVGATASAQDGAYEYYEGSNFFRPRGVFEVQGGLGGFTGNMARVAPVGGNWQLRAGVELLPWIAVSANYSGLAANVASDLGGPNTSIVNNGIFGDVRLIAPLYRVRPYVFAGVGYNWMNVVYRDGGPQNSPLRSTSAPILPFGLGINFQITRSLFVGVEGTYERNLANTTLTPSNPALGRGDTWNTAVSLSYRTF